MTNSTKKEEHKIIEDAWIAIGPQGLAAAAVAIAAVGSSTGWINSIYTALFGISGVVLWIVVMKFLLLDRPDGYTGQISRNNNNRAPLPINSQCCRPSADLPENSVSAESDLEARGRL